MMFRIYILLIATIFLFGCASRNDSIIQRSNENENYLVEVKRKLQVKWPKNKTINIVFHGHSVPSGYFKTPKVNTLNSYPYLVLKKLKDKYPYAVINTIVTGVGGEKSDSGEVRFYDEVLNHNPDVILIDYGLNDRRIGLELAKISWEKMIDAAKKRHIPVILLTPSPDLRVDYRDSKNELSQHAKQIRDLAKKHLIGLVDSYKAFEFLYNNKKKLKKYMAQVDHPNQKGHELITSEIMKYF